MAQLVDDLLILASADAQTWSVRFSPVDWDTLLIECYESYEPLARAKSQRLSLALPDSPFPPYRGDAQRHPPGDRHPAGQRGALHGRGRRDHPPGGCLHPQPDHPGRGSWTGIPPENRERIFERFYRADQSRSDRDHFGLGLSIARELAALHGGKLFCRDTPGGGSTFVLELPLPRHFELSLKIFCRFFVMMDLPEGTIFILRRNTMKKRSIAVLSVLLCLLLALGACSQQPAAEPAPTPGRKRPARRDHPQRPARALQAHLHPRYLYGRGHRLRRAYPGRGDG